MRRFRCNFLFYFCILLLKRSVFTIRLSSTSSKLTLEDEIISEQSFPDLNSLSNTNLLSNDPIEQISSIPSPTVHPELPLFIIGGTQKSGSTVLAGYLAHHPNVSFATRKELHFFDKVSNYEKGISHYQSEFVITSNSTIKGEATPYYIASRKACERIALHFPKVRMLIILREPIARAYSEYQMKVRRVKEQNHFYSLIEENLNIVMNCIHKYPLQYKKIESCLPKSISKHGRYPKLTRAFKKSYEKLKDWKKVVYKCFRKEEDKYAICPTSSTTITSVHDQKYSMLDYDRFQKYIVNETCSRNITEWQSFESSLFTFTPQSCWEYYKEGHESVKSLKDAFETEIVDFQKCLAKVPRQTKGNSATNRIKQVDKAVTKCIQVQGGISKQYFYRSLYVAQLYHCFKSIDSSQFLIIGNKELRYKPLQTMKTVCKFLDIPFEPMQEILDKQQIEDLINSKFPSFEKTTAWKIKSEYDPIPSDVEQYLQTFYLEHNILLFHYLQRNFTKIW